MGDSIFRKNDRRSRRNLRNLIKKPLLLLDLERVYTIIEGQITVAFYDIDDDETYIIKRFFWNLVAETLLKSGRVQECTEAFKKIA